jgi:hypothetical protein
LRPTTSCSGPDLEVLAPTLSKQPIFVRAQAVAANDKIASAPGEESYEDSLEDALEDDDSLDHGEKTKKLTVAQQRLEPERKAVFKAAQSFLGYYVKLENVAHSVQRIRMDKKKSDTKKKSDAKSGPRLEVDVIVCPDGPESSLGREEPIATMKLIRMVNNIPLLDGAEGCACGLVHGLANKLIWGSFGLHVTQSNDLDKDSWTPLYNVRDSDQVAPFFQQRQHGLWTGGSKDSGESDSNKYGSQKRKHQSMNKASFPPAKARLGDITVVIKIQAAPSSLPLPTLSKVRQPLQ